MLYLLANALKRNMNKQ